MKNLLLFDKDLNVRYLINYVDREIEGNIYNDQFKFLQLKEDLFNELSNKIQENTIKLIEAGINKIDLTIKDFELTPILKAPSQTEALSNGLLENTLTVMNLEGKVKALSKAILEMTITGK